MTSEELNAIRRETQDIRVHYDTFFDKPLLPTNPEKLLAYVDFLRTLLHDLQQDSTAYQRGLEEGIRQERERCIQIVLHGGDDEDRLETAIRHGTNAAIAEAILASGQTMDAVHRQQEE